MKTVKASSKETFPPITVLPFGGMVGKPIAGWLADCLGQQRIVFLLALLFTGVIQVYLYLADQ